MDKVIIRDLVVHAIIGVYASERTTPQDILINIELVADLRLPGKTDNIGDCINYHTLTNKIIAHTKASERLTVEALATDLANICLSEKGVISAKVRVEKPHAIEHTKSVGVEIVRKKTN